MENTPKTPDQAVLDANTAAQQAVQDAWEYLYRTLYTAFEKLGEQTRRLDMEVQVRKNSFEKLSEDLKQVQADLHEEEVAHAETQVRIAGALGALIDYIDETHAKNLTLTPREKKLFRTLAECLGSGYARIANMVAGVPDEKPNTEEAPAETTK